MISKLLILVGNIGSGKSTFAKDFCKKNNYICISRDSLRSMIGVGEYIFNTSYEPYLKKAMLELVERFMRGRFNIVIDEVNISRSSRAPLLALARSFAYQPVAYVLPELHKEESVARRLSANHGDERKETWDMIWERFNESYEYPTEEEGFCHVRMLKGDTSEG